MASSDYFDALMHFFQKFPKIADNPIYISGESYAGIYVPYLAWRIHEYNTNAVITKKAKIPFKGIIVGNGATHWDFDTYNSYYPMAYMHNMMDADTWYTIEEDNCTFYFEDVKPSHVTQSCILALSDFNENTERINWYDIYRPVCDNGPILPRLGSVKDEEGNTHFYNRGFHMSEYTPWMAKHLTEKNDHRLGDGVSDYLNSYEIRRELHIPSNMPSWQACRPRAPFGDWQYDL